MPEKEKVIPDPQHIENCYGKLVFMNNNDPCQYRKICKWGKCCKDASREELENKYYHSFRVVSVGNMFLDPEESDKNKPIHNKTDIQDIAFDETEEDTRNSEMEAMAEISKKSMDNMETWMQDIAGIQIPSEEALECVFAVVEKIIAFSDEKPFAFKCLKEIIYKNKNQSQIAKDNNLSRQAVSKRLYKELCINDDRNTKRKSLESQLQKQIEKLDKKQDVFRYFTDSEFAVYKEIKNNPTCSVTLIAQKTSLARKTVYHAIKSIKEKYGIELKIIPYAFYTKKKKGRKNNEKQK